jgi:hypothetical protein
MFFRFGVALALVVVVSLIGTALEKRTLQLKQAVSRQHYRLEILEERFTAERVLAQRLGAPARLIDQLEPEPEMLPQSEKPAASHARGSRKNRHSRPASKRTTP